ncbi:hypothetical protein [Rhodanobacter sp. Root480]|uniref:hypothetical protein n=1 Tax=Rhodanobacter sp. Root480 TaxID=1736542 RepID=UPI0012E3C987|nr:hypothetical protein [Rhodanobacter sp. Root480]
MNLVEYSGVRNFCAVVAISATVGTLASLQFVQSTVPERPEAPVKRWRVFDAHPSTARVTKVTAVLDPSLDHFFRKFTERFEASQSRLAAEDQVLIWDDLEGLLS